jgi:hypothetical protein
MLPGLLYLLLGLAAGAYSIFALVVLIYAAGPMRGPLLSAYQNAHISSGSRATVLSLINMLAHLWIAIGTVVSGVLADVSIPLVFALTGAAILLATLLLRVDKIPTETA